MSIEPISNALIVDDNFFNRDLAALALRHVGYEVSEAENGVEALNRLKQHAFNLLVLDLAMPEMDGVTLLRQLRSQSDNRRMVIVVMTANPHMATSEVAAEVDFIMYKPIDVNDFAQFAERLRKRATLGSSPNDGR
ncbi:MAG: response regulator [Chloroflexota bacterium]|nr:response regulator [Chloroflexota bacterium]